MHQSLSFYCNHRILIENCEFSIGCKMSTNKQYCSSMVNLLHENLDFEMCLLATIHGVPKHGRWQICEDINACDANYNDCVNSNLHTCHCTIHGISNKNYTEALSHIRVDIGEILKNIHYFCVIK